MFSEITNQHQGCHFESAENIKHSVPDQQESVAFDYFGNLFCRLSRPDSALFKSLGTGMLERGRVLKVMFLYVSATTPEEYFAYSTTLGCVRL